MSQNKELNKKELIAGGYARVTEVLDFFKEPGLVDWMLTVGKKEAKEKSKVALKYGTRVHELTEQLDLNQQYKLKTSDSVEVVNCMKAYRQFREDHRPTYLEIEQTVANHEERVVGTYDRHLPGEILDIKTSNKINRKYWIQLAVYAWLSGFPIEHLSVLRLDKNLAIYEYKKIVYHEGVIWVDDQKIDAVGVYKGLLALYRFLK